MMSNRRNSRTNTPGLHATLQALLFLAVFFLPVGPAAAGTFQIAPTLGDVPSDRSTATFRIMNPGDTPMTVQVRAYRWTQAGNEDVHVPADDLIIVPPLINVAPGATQIIRIAHKRRDTGSEAAYRVHFEEVPSAPPAGFIGLQTALKLDVPLFFAPGNAEGRLEWTVKKTPRGIALDIENTGTRFARFANIELADHSGRVIAHVKGPQYALAGATRQWNFTGVPLERGAKLTAIVRMGAVRQEVPLVVE